MPCIDAVELVIPMTKGEGELPDLSDLKSTAIKKAISLSVDTDTLKGFGYTHYRIVKAGEKSNTITIKDGGVEGYPTLQVRLYAYPDMKQVKINIFHDDLVLVSECFSYRVQRGDEVFFFGDQNGYAKALRVTSEMKSPEEFDEKIRSKSIAL